MITRSSDITMEISYDAKKKGFQYHVLSGETLLFSEYEQFTGDFDRENNMLKEWCVNQSQKYEENLLEIYYKLLTENSVHAYEVVSQITRAVDYSVQSGLDIYFGSDVFRVDKDAYINSKPFQIWYLAVRHKFIEMTEKEYKEMIVIALDMAEKSIYDPIAPDVISYFTYIIKNNVVHTSRECDNMRDEIQVAPSDSHFFYDGENYLLYCTKGVINSIKDYKGVSGKKMRQFIQPFLATVGEDMIYIGRGKKVDKVRERFWVFSMEKLSEYDENIRPSALHLVDCNNNDEAVSRLPLLKR